MLRQSKPLPSSELFDTDSIASLSIYSPARSIENILLCGDLSKALELPCEITVTPHLRPANDLLIFDCIELSISKIQDWLHHFPSDKKCALINVSVNSSQEQLIEWPQIRAMFYRSEGTSKVIAGLRNVINGELWLPRHLCHNFIFRMRKAPCKQRAGNDNKNIKLTRREAQMLNGIKLGHSNKRIAAELSLSEHTIKSHLYSTYKKLGVRTRLEASNWIRENSDLLDKTLN